MPHVPGARAGEPERTLQSLRIVLRQTGQIGAACSIGGTRPRQVATVTTTYSIRVYETATAEETTLDRTQNDAKAIDAAEREAERLTEHLGRKLDTDGARFEPDGWGRYLVWKPLGEHAEEAVYVVTVEEKEQDDDLA